MSYSFTETLRKHMEAKGLDYKEVAVKVDRSPEHIRKLYNSETFPSRALQGALTNLLEINPVEFQSQVNADRWRAKYGKIPTSTQARHPILPLWDELTQDQQSTLLCMARCMTKQKKRKAA